MQHASIADSAAALVADIPDGAKIALFKDSSVPMAAGRALIHRGIRALHLVTVPTGGLLPDMLIGAGCVATIETAGVTLGEFGLAPRFIDAVRNGRVNIKDATCPALYAGLQAAGKGIPFMPLRGLLGTDLLASRPDFKVVDNPFADGDPDPIVCLPAICPDAALFHVPLADRYGNVYYGRLAELKILAHAARDTYVTAEKVVDFNLLEDERYACGTLNALYVSAIAECPQGAWPLNLPGHYEQERELLQHYARIARDADGFDAWLAEHLGAAGRRAA